ncbi:MAG TPA: ATP-binding protein [Solirubrobacterales bacterium]
MEQIQSLRGLDAAPGTSARRLKDDVASTLSRWEMMSGIQRLGVGVSGGADSLVLLEVMQELVGGEVELVPVHVHQHPKSQDADRLKEYVESRFRLETEVVRADTSSQVKKVLAKGKSPCRACAPVRARRLGDASKQLRLDAMALGHHLDDAVATLLMNIFHRGEVETMRPVARRRTLPNIPLLRPMLLSAESDVKGASPVGPAGLFDCGVCSVHAQERARASAFVAEMFRLHGPASRHTADLVEALAEKPL